MFYLCIRLITKHMDEITKIETVDQYDQLFGLETLHPLVNVIDFSKATKSVEYIRMNIGFYCLFLKDAKCGDLTYGRKNYDYQEGTVVCMAPGQVSGIDNRNRTAPRTKSIGVLFHPDLIRGTSLGQNRIYSGERFLFKRKSNKIQGSLQPPRSRPARCSRKRSRSSSSG